MRHKATLYDPNASYLELCLWAKKHCVSYYHSYYNDVSDISYNFDMIYEFCFRDEKDATMFYLRWS